MVAGVSRAHAVVGTASRGIVDVVDVRIACRANVVPVCTYPVVKASLPNHLSRFPSRDRVISVIILRHLDDSSRARRDSRTTSYLNRSKFASTSDARFGASWLYTAGNR